MALIRSEHAEKYREETNALLYQKVWAILWIGIILIPLFTVLDYVVVRDSLELFFIYRITCAGLFLILLWIYLTEIGRRHPFVIAITAYILAGSTISMMVVNLGGYASFYYVGILMVLVTFSTFLPLNARQGTISGLLLYFIYAVPIFLLCEPTSANIRMFFNNSFFFIFFILITIAQCYWETKAWEREFKLRTEMDNLAQRLSYYAHNLEEDVDKRSKALQESELRYRELYENIIDIVILTDRQGNILMANPRFYDTIGISKDTNLGFTFMKFIHPDDVDLVKKQLLDRLIHQKDVENIQFRIINKYNKIFDVECNARCIQKDNSLIGYQMVVRDITERKKLEDELIESYKRVHSARSATILGLAKLAEYRDSDTGAHLERIREFSKILAQELAKQPKYKDHITEEYIEDLYNSSILHDIGKVGVPDSILLKPGKLTREEFEIVKRHSRIGGDALKTVETRIEGQSFLSLGKEIAYYHHEKWDGTGYPEGLKGEQIPLSARIVALADVYDALTSKRCYKEAFSHEKSYEIILNDKGTHFDPDIVDTFVRMEKEFNNIRKAIHSEPQKTLAPILKKASGNNTK